MRRVAFVTCEKIPQLTEDDQLAAAELRRRGITVEPVIWNRSAGWHNFDAVILRSCWDYHLHPKEFLAWAAARQHDGTLLWNPAATVRWNADKSYLQDLQHRGVRVVPTEWIAQGARANLSEILRRRAWSRAVIKPAISATAYRTHAVERGQAAAAQVHLDEILREGGALVQEFVPMEECGEWSFLFYGGEFSHAVLKLPRAGDFRVQHDFGGTAQTLPPVPEILQQVEHILEVAGRTCLYARVDGVARNGRFALMELELIEPALYFADHPEAPTRFAAAVEQLF